MCNVETYVGYRCGPSCITSNSVHAEQETVKT